MVCFANTYPLDSDLSDRKCYLPCERLGAQIYQWGKGNLSFDAFFLPFDFIEQEPRGDLKITVCSCALAILRNLSSTYLCTMHRAALVRENYSVPLTIAIGVVRGSHSSSG